MSRDALGHVAANQIEALGPILHADHVADANQVARNIDAAAVDRDVAVANHLAGLGAAQAEAEAMDDVVQPALEQHHQRVARVALAADGFLEVLAELALEHAVIMLDLLLLAQGGRRSR